MNLLYIECQMGAAGDMIMGALYELLPKEKQAVFESAMNQLPFQDVSISVDRMKKCGIVGTKMKVIMDGEICDELQHHHPNENEHGHNHIHHASKDHGHAHRSAPSHEHVHAHNPYEQHNHFHMSYTNVMDIVSDLDIGDKIKEDVIQIYSIIGNAESKVHNTTIEQIHFHEVGTVDAIVDVIGCCLLIHMLKPEKIVVSPIHVGSGTVTCAHGVLPVPAPATAEILSGVPIYSNSIKGELCTPTGAAILKHFADDFNNMPEMIYDKIGYGMGTKDFSSANCLRTFWGTPYKKKLINITDDISEQQILEISCNLDDMTGEAIGHAVDILNQANTLDVFVTSISMKKNRPGAMLTCLCHKDEEYNISLLMLTHTTTKGVRMKEYRRYILDANYKVVKTKYGDITVKIYSGYDIEKFKPEYQEVSKASKIHDVSFQKVFDEVIKEYQKTSVVSG